MKRKRCGRPVVSAVLAVADAERAVTSRAGILPRETTGQEVAQASLASLAINVSLPATPVPDRVAPEALGRHMVALCQSLPRTDLPTIHVFAIRPSAR